MKTKSTFIRLPEKDPIPFTVFENDYVGDIIQQFGCWEPQITTFFIQLVKENNFRCFVDVGAHYGYYSKLYKEYGKGRTVSIEPNPITREMTLRENLAGYSDSIIESDLIASTSGDHLGFKLSNSNTGGSKIEASGDLKVKSRSLKDVLGKRPPDLLKIDVEGHEFGVIQELGDVFFGNLSHILIELTPITFHDSAESSIDILLKNGFKLYNLGIIEGGTLPEYVNPPAIDKKAIMRKNQINLYALRT